MEKVLTEKERLEMVIIAIEKKNKEKPKESWHPNTLAFYERMKEEIVKLGNPSATT